MLLFCRGSNNISKWTLSQVSWKRKGWNFDKGLLLDPLSPLCTVLIQAGVSSIGKCCMLLDETSEVPYSSTLQFKLYCCILESCTSTSIKELLLVRNSFELILVYSCCICSHGCPILCHCHCQALGSCERLQTYWGGKQSSWLWRSSHGHCFSRIPQNKASSSYMPRLSQPCQQAYKLKWLFLCAFSDAKSCWTPRNLVSLSFIFTCGRIMCCLFLWECNI